MAHPGLTALDTWVARGWRERERLWRQEQRLWRSEDMAFRVKERLARNEEYQLHELKYRWREEDVQQRMVNNSHYLWSRFSELNRRDVEEKSEHLRSLSWLTGLITSFTMTSPVEFNAPQGISTARLTSYAICTAVVPMLMTTSTIISIYLLKSILKMGKWFVAEDAEEEFMARCRLYGENSDPFEAPPAPRRTFEQFWDIRCKDDWMISFRLFIWGAAFCCVLFFLGLLCTMGPLQNRLGELLQDLPGAEDGKRIGEFPLQHSRFAIGGDPLPIDNRIHGSSYPHSYFGVLALGSGSNSNLGSDVAGQNARNGFGLSVIGNYGIDGHRLFKEEGIRIVCSKSDLA